MSVRLSVCVSVCVCLSAGLRSLSSILSAAAAALAKNEKFTAALRDSSKFFVFCEILRRLAVLHFLLVLAVNFSFFARSYYRRLADLHFLQVRYRQFVKSVRQKRRSTQNGPGTTYGFVYLSVGGNIF